MYPDAVMLFIVCDPPVSAVNVTCPAASVVCAVPSTVTVAPAIAVPPAFWTVKVKFPGDSVTGTHIPPWQAKPVGQG